MLRNATLATAVLTSIVSASILGVDGRLSSDVTWSADTVQVNSHLTVDSAVTLTIPPGTLIMFQGHYRLGVRGRVLAMGTMEDSIVFTARDSMTGWQGIRFDSTVQTSDSSRFVFCRIQFGRAGAAGSLCIDAGTPDTTGLGLGASDAGGNPRIHGGRIDIGALEYQGSTALLGRQHGSPRSSGAALWTVTRMGGLREMSGAVIVPARSGMRLPHSAYDPAGRAVKSRPRVAKPGAPAN